MTGDVRLCDYRLAGRHIVINPSVRLLCQRPYPGHSRGCPNFGKRGICPPAAPMFDEVIDCSEPVLIAWAEYDLEAHRQKMWFRHPRWTKRQVECCLYWQGHVTRVLDRKVRNYLQNDLHRRGPELRAFACPEAMAVDVTATMKVIDVEMEWPPEKIVRKVVLIGSLR